MNPVWFILSIILLPLTTVQTAQYKKVGDKIVLSPGSVDAPISSITWKHNSYLAVEWFGTGEADFYPKFRGRSELKTETGELIIPNPTPEDSGIYTPEINNRVLDPTELKVISGVPKPTVSENCDAEKTYCVLTCEGITTDCEPVTYTWWSGNVTNSKTTELNITKEETEPSFICEIKNPVSSECSREVLNPFISSPSPPSSNTVNLFWIRAILVALFLVVGVGLIVFYTHKGNKAASSLPVTSEYVSVQDVDNGAEKSTSVDLEE